MRFKEFRVAVCAGWRVAHKFAVKFGSLPIAQEKRETCVKPLSMRQFDRVWLG